MTVQNHVDNNFIYLSQSDYTACTWVNNFKLCQKRLILILTKECCNLKFSNCEDWANSVHNLTNTNILFILPKPTNANLRCDKISQKLVYQPQRAVITIGLHCNLQSHMFEVGRMSFGHDSNQDSDLAYISEFNFNIENELIKENQIRTVAKSLLDTQADIKELTTENSAINNMVFTIIADNKLWWDEATDNMGEMKQMAIWTAILEKIIVLMVILSIVARK